MALSTDAKEMVYEAQRLSRAQNYLGVAAMVGTLVTCALSGYAITLVSKSQWQFEQARAFSLAFHFAILIVLVIHDLLRRRSEILADNILEFVEIRGSPIFPSFHSKSSSR